MGVLFMDGFDLYNGVGTAAGNLGSKWTIDGAAPQLIAGRFGGLRVAGVDTTQTQRIVRALPTTQQHTMSLGFAFRAARLTSNSRRFFEFMNGTTVHVAFDVTASGGAIEVRNGSGTLLGTSSGVIVTNAEHYVEIGVYIHDTAGNVRIKVDGVTVLNLTNVDTRNGTPTHIDSLRFTVNASGNPASLFQFDDLYVLDSFDSLGERRIETLRPNADTATKQWTPTPSGATNFTAVDDTTFDGTDYVQTGTVGNTDLYELADLAGSPTIDAVQVIGFASKTDSGTRAFALVADIGGAQLVSPDFYLPASAAKHEHIMESKPGGGAWSAASVNSLRAGPRVTV